MFTYVHLPRNMGQLSFGTKMNIGPGLVPPTIPVGEMPTQFADILNRIASENILISRNSLNKQGYFCALRAGSLTLYQTPTGIILTEILPNSHLFPEPFSKKN